MQRLGPEINRLRPPASGTTITYGTVPLQQRPHRHLRQPLLMLWAAVAVVLLIACVNLAGLMFARGARRGREIATRLALGSGRAAIVRQLVVESALLAVAGAALGLRPRCRHPPGAHRTGGRTPSICGSRSRSTRAP